MLSDHLHRKSIAKRLVELRVNFYALDVQSDASPNYPEWKWLLDEIRALERQLTDVGRSDP